MSRPTTILGELSVLPLSSRYVARRGACRLVGVIQVNPHQPGPVRGFVVLPRGNPGDEVAQVANHSGGIKYERGGLGNPKFLINEKEEWDEWKECDQWEETEPRLVVFIRGGG